MIKFRREIGPFRLFVTAQTTQEDHKTVVLGHCSIIMYGKDRLEGSWKEDFTEQFERITEPVHVDIFLLRNAERRTEWDLELLNA